MKAMRERKGEAKIAGPLFPRLHVNDTDKGGPKPPPRNKMALYEQLSLPSQRSADSHLSMLPLPPVYGGSLTNTESSSQGLGLEKATFPSFQISSSAYHLDGRRGSFSADTPLNKTDGNTIQRSIATQHTRNIDVMEISDRTSTCAFEPGAASHFKWPSLLKDDTESKAPSIGYLAMDINQGNDHSTLTKESYFTDSNCSLPLQATGVKKLKTSDSSDQPPEEHLKFLNEKGLKIHETVQGHERNQCSYPQASLDHDKIVTDDLPSRHVSSAISLKPLTGEEQSELSNQAPMSLNSNHKSNGQDETTTTKGWDHLDMDLGLNKVPSGDVIEQPKVSGVSNGCVLRSDLCHESPATYSRSQNTVRNSHQYEDEKEPGLVPTYVLKKDDDIPNASQKGSKSGVFICPDDVVEMIGHTHFWKARRAIIDQQRAFAMQVFELHRIIKVQEIIAGSRSLIMKESLFLGKAMRKASSMKESLHNPITDDPLSLVKSRDDLPKIKLATDNAVEKKTRTLRNDVTNVASTGHKLGNSAALSSLLDPKVPTPMWCLPPLGNQWLIPVMSPSEGLVYKPCTEPPSQSPGGVLASLYGSVGPLKATMPGGELLNSHCGYFPGAAPTAPTYFSPCGMPILSPSGPISTVEHTGKKVGSDNILSLYQSSCTVASERNVGKTLVPKETESLESKACVPKKRTASDALLLFPTAPTDRVTAPPVRSGSNEQKTEVIRVIPRNPKLASESAARIIQLIQEERKYLCN